MKRTLVALAVMTCCSAAQADALYGKAEAFKARAHGLIRPAGEAMVAVQCGLRPDAWRVQVGRSVQRRIVAAADQVWPNPQSATRRAALMEVSQDLEADLATTLSVMTRDDCETLKTDQAELRRLDTMAVDGAH